MRLLKLSLENWRGVQQRSLEFADGVTLIEGPNEIGKSTIVEALLLLISELDSSSKKGVKAVQPVGEDVGSTVEAELVTGDYHFSYTKTFNKNKRTELKILKPCPEQITGREAHERAEEIINSTIDRALFDALLVEQGKEITGAHLSDSAGLAKALDAAAGTAKEDESDSAIYDAIRVEYENYFTGKTGKSKFADLDREIEQLEGTVRIESEALTKIEADVEAMEVAEHEISRLKNALPGLNATFVEHQKNWADVSDLKRTVLSKAEELRLAEEVMQAADEDKGRRVRLNERISTAKTELKESEDKLAPLSEELSSLENSVSEHAAELTQLRNSKSEANRRASIARSDEKHAQRLANISRLKNILEKVDSLKDQLKTQRANAAGIRVDTEGLERIREAHNALQLSRGKLETASSFLRIVASTDLQVRVNEDIVQLEQGGSEERTVASHLEIDIPNIANIQFKPSMSAAELESHTEGLKTALDLLLTEYNVDSLPDAIAKEALRTESERESKQIAQKIDDALEERTEEDIATEIGELELSCTEYLDERESDTPIPDSVEIATASRFEAEEAARQSDEAVNNKLSEHQDLREEHNQKRAEFTILNEEAEGINGTILQLTNELTEAQSTESDVQLEKRAKKRAGQVEELNGELQELNRQLESSSPEGVELLMTNAKDAVKRAEKDLSSENTKLAILQDRLKNAQANGRFEALDHARHQLEELGARRHSISKRADAAALLWETINKYRDLARSAYVRPLKDGIESLGKIVFDPDFAVELDEDWTLISRTQGGKTIPFDDLSVGAKEQLGILTRLAAAKIVSGQGGVPLIIDDALGFSDPSRLESMGAAIASAGRDCQVILLTCTPGRFMHVGNAETLKL